eukprot:3356682-Pyramimonas_sp.AAC.1
MVSEQLRELTLPSGPAQKLARVQEVVGAAAVEFKKALKCRTAGNDAERLHYAFMAYRGWRGRQWYFCLRAIRCYASLLLFFDVDGGVCTDPDGLHSL